MRTRILVSAFALVIAAASFAAAQPPVPPVPPVSPAAPAAPAAPKAAPPTPAVPAPGAAPTPVIVAPGRQSITHAEAARLAAELELLKASVGEINIDIEAAALAREAVASVDTEALARSARELAAQVAASGTGQETASEAARRAAREAAARAERDAARVERDVARQAERVVVRESPRLKTSREDQLYSSGSAALDASQWTKALDIFVQIIEMRGARVDAAMYWKAYAQYKLAQREAALTTIQELQKAYASSRWLGEANALAVQIRSAVGDAATAESGDDELKLLALNGLMESGNTDQAVAMLEKMLKSQQSPKLKKRALFVLSQSSSPKARDVVLAIAKGGSNPDLQMDAIQYLGMFGGKENQQVLADIYSVSTDVAMKRRILQAYMVSGQRDRLLAAAKSEANATLRLEAIRMLGAQGATAELAQLYQVEKSAELKDALIEAFMMTGNVDRLLEIAKTETDPAVKFKAVRTLGVLGSAKTGPILAELYASPGSTPEIKRAVIDGLFMQQNAKALVDIARKETDPALRKSLVERLSLMKSKEATDFLLELLNK